MDFAGDCVIFMNIMNMYYTILLCSICIVLYFIYVYTTINKDVSAPTATAAAVKVVAAAVAAPESTDAV